MNRVSEHIIILNETSTNINPPLAGIVLIMDIVMRSQELNA